MMRPAGEEGAWVEVATLGRADPTRRRHWIRSSGFEVNAVQSARGPHPQPFLTVRHARAKMTSGEWWQARKSDPHHLRLPDEIVSLEQAAEPDTPLVGASFREAERFARLFQGRLPTEKEADLLAATLRPVPPRIPMSFRVWTASRYSRFAYSACVWDLDHSRWRETDFDLPPSGPQAEERRSVLRVDLTSREITRECVSAIAAGIAVWIIDAKLDT